MKLAGVLLHPSAHDMAVKRDCASRAERTFRRVWRVSSRFWTTTQNTARPWALLIDWTTLERGSPKTTDWAHSSTASGCLAMC